MDRQVVSPDTCPPVAAPAPSRAALLRLIPADPGADHALLERLRGTDAVQARAALEALFHTYYAPLVRVACCYRGFEGRDGAEEIVQDLFVALWSHRAQLEVRGSLATYLCIAVRNRALNRLRAERRRAAVVTRALAGEDPDTADHDPVSADSAALTRERAVALEHAIGALPPRVREAFMLQRMHDLSYTEVAQVMGVSPSTVKNQIARALQLLRESPALSGILDHGSPAET